MTILCIFCKPTKSNNGRKPGKGGESTVLASRRVNSRTRDNQDNTTRTKTMRRYRKCLTCGYRWSTLEYAEPAKRGSNHGNPNFRKTDESRNPQSRTRE